AKEHAAQIRSVRQVHIDKDLYRLNFYNELYFDPAKTVAHGMNSAHGCRILIECYRTFYARLCDSAMLSSREYEFIMTLCGQQVEIPIGTIESQVVYRTLKIAQMRYESDQYETLRSAVDYYSNIILKHLLAGNYPIPGNISSMLAKIHNILMDEIRNHFDFNIEKFDEFNANTHFKGTGRQLFMEFRRYVAKKIWELRRRARMFEQIEPGIPLEITYSEADKKELLFYRNHLAQLEKQLKDSNSQLKSAGIIESGRNKISHFFASNHEVNDTAPA
ncbi:MAG: hypothetical protein ACKPHU_34950, partial [Planctomycetaceae bacterium]